MKEADGKNKAYREDMICAENKTCMNDKTCMDAAWMREVVSRTAEAVYLSGQAGLFCGDVFGLLKKVRTGSIDMIFADPPYFLSNDGITCQGGRMVSVNKAGWDRLEKENGGRLVQMHRFNRRWIRLCRRVLKKDGTIWISGTLHNIYSIGMALEQEGFRLINNITWQKTNPPPNLACRCFTHSTETVLWAQKAEKGARHYYNYELMKEMNGGKQMKDVWSGGLTKASEKKEGKHPTQKPEYLLERIVLASTREGDFVLDPFCGSGTTGVAALRYGRRFLGMDSSSEYLMIAKRRLEKEQAAHGLNGTKEAKES